LGARASSLPSGETALPLGPRQSKAAGSRKAQDEVKASPGAREESPQGPPPGCVFGGLTITVHAKSPCRWKVFPGCKAHGVSRSRVRSNLRRFLSPRTSREGAKALGETRKSDRDTRGSTSLGAVGTKRPRHGRFKADVREHRDGPPKRSEHRETLLPPKPKEEIGPNRSLRNQPAIHCRQGLWKQARCRSTQFRFGWHSKVGHILGFVGEASSDFASTGL